MKLNKMIDMKKLVFVALCLAFVWGAKAQKVVETIDLYEDYAVCMPIMFDSTDVNGKSFSLFDALKTDRRSREVSQELSCNGDGWFSFAVAKGEMRVVNLGFKIVASDCSEAEFKVITPCDLKADFVNASSEKKSSAGDTLTLKADFDKGVYNVSLSLLVNEDCNRLKVICEGKGLVCSPSSAKEPFSLETMLQGKHLYSVNLSPSGNYYLLVYSETDNKGKTKWTWQLKSTDEDRLLYQGNNYFSISWLPKSDLLYYCGKQDGRNTMWVLNPETLTLEVLAQDFPEGQVKFLNNEQAFLIATKDKLNEQRGEVNRVLSPEDRIGDDWRERRDLWLYRLGNKALQRLTFSSHDVALHDVSADGNRALISLSYDDFTHRPFGYRRFFELDLRTLAVDTLFADAFVSDVRYFDDNLLLVSASCEAFDGISAKVGKKQIPNMYHSTLLAWDKASCTAKAILRDFDPSINSFEIKGDKVVMLTTDKDSVNVYLMLPKENYRCEKINLPCDVVNDFTCTDNCKKALFIGQNYNKPKRLFSYCDGKSSEILFPEKEKYDKVSLGEMYVWNNKTKNGLIEGRYYLPDDFDSTKTYPMIVYYYGGTTPSDRSFESRYSPYLYTAEGYVVYVLNPSGTIGYGQEFAARHVNAWGKMTANDIIESVKAFCKSHAFVDKSKIGCIGASYGGFMTQYLISHSDIFAAAVSHAGISNITSYWGEGYWGYSYSAAASAGSYPWNSPELYTEQSPLFRADKINTPLLLLHGTSDTNVPIGESIQMYNALKILGKEVEFVRVNGENHGIMDYEKRLKWNKTIFAWFSKHLKGNSSLWDKMYPQSNIEK
ncbi:MAG: prolyl oligopeptidase family serine peptidase [Candidatus Onthomorpha sp.]|nr:prolyl oligopeptidase family serine peptidase [Candidatus Onthomorpha sp.]